MRLTEWAARVRSAVVPVADRLLRGLLALGVMATGAMAPGWLNKRGEHWWEGAAHAKAADLPTAATPRAESITLRDLELLEELRSLRGSQDLPRLDGTAGADRDPAPHWHPERRPVRDD
jgi:hypothetical protein